MKKFFTVMLFLTMGLLAEEQPRIFYASGGEPATMSDTLTGFAEPVSLQAAADNSEAGLLYDENHLFLHFTGFHPPERKMQKLFPGKSLFSVEHMEFFIQPENESGVYYHIAVTPGGDLYTAKKKDISWKNQINAFTSGGDNFWHVKLAIPLTDLGIEARDGMKVRFNICRDIRYDGLGFKSCYAPLPTESFHLPETWSEAIFIRTPAPPARFETRMPPRDLFNNSEFNLAENNMPKDWVLGRGAVRQETMALSGEWIIRCSGNTYAAIQKKIDTLVPGREYSLRIRARKFGEDVSMGVLLLSFREDGSFKGNYPALVWKYPLSNEFKEYLFSFIAPEKPALIGFYRISGEKENQTNGVDFAAISLFEGRLTPFSIRSFSFFKVGLKRGIPGTGPLRPDNLYGKRPEKLRILGIARSLRISYDLLDIFSGLNVELDQLAITGTTWDITPDIYFTDSPPEVIEKRIQNNDYDLYLISNYSAAHLGPELLKILRKNLELGSGLWINDNKPGGNFDFLTGTTSAQTTEYTGSGVPYQEIRIGKGRVVLSKTGEEFEVSLPAAAPFQETARSHAQLARMIYHAAGFPQLIQNLTLQNGLFTFQTSKGSAFRWQCTDSTGRIVAKGEGISSHPVTEVSFTPSPASGEHSIFLWLVDHQGNTIDYTDGKFICKGPEILSCKSDHAFYTGNNPALFTVKNAALRPGMELLWTLSDWSGRVLESGRMSATPENRFSVPLDAVHTNRASLRVSLMDRETEIFRVETGVLVPDRDRKRFCNDFTVSNWNSSMAPQLYAKQLQYIGIENCLRPSFDLDLMLSAGFGVCGNDRGGSVFYPGKYPKDNIRNPSLNDPAVMQKVEKNCLEIAEKELKYGLIFATITDEPGLSSRNWAIDAGEVDAHPENLNEYRKRMKAKYGNIEQFNTQCDTHYRNFEEIRPVLTSEARKRNNFAEFIEWRKFNSDRWTETVARLGQITREHDPDMPLCLYNSFGPRGTGGNDYWKLLTQGNIGFSLEYTSMVYPEMRNPLYDFDELYRSFRPDMRLWGFIGYYWSRELAIFQPWWYALHRYGGFCWFGMTSTDGGGTLLETPSLNITQEAGLIREGVLEAGLLDGFGKLCLEFPWDSRDLAVLYSHNSMLTAWCRGKETDNDVLTPGSPYHDWHFARYGLRYLLEDLLYQYDFISPEQLENGSFGKRKIIFLPQATALSDSSVAALSGFLEKDGWLVSDTMPGNWTELGVPRTVSPFSAFRNHPRFIVTGKPFDERDPECRREILKNLLQAGVKPVLASPQVPQLIGREAMCFIRDGLKIYALTRNPSRSEDCTKQTFIFQEQGNIYELRSGKFLGNSSQVTLDIPPGETVLLGHYPYRITSLDVDAPSRVKAGTDLHARIAVCSDSGKAGTHIFNIKIIPPGNNQTTRLMSRNETATAGRLNFNFRMAQNDPPGLWKLQVKDIMSGTVREQNFVLD